jgi:hypothetical protein
MTTFSFGVFIVHISQCLPPIAGEEARKYIPLLLFWPTTEGKSRQIYGIFGTQIAKGGGGENFTLNCNKCRDSGPQSEIATQILEKLYTGGEFPRIYGS